jgi:hypothetical protein
MCRIGGGPDGVCSSCRQAAAQSKQNQDLQGQLLALAKRVVDLEEAFLSQAQLIGELTAQRQGSDGGSK